jgi:hypothetical protein
VSQSVDGSFLPCGGGRQMNNFVGSHKQLINLDHVRKLQFFEDNTVEVTYSNGDVETIAEEQQPELYRGLMKLGA